MAKAKRSTTLKPAGNQPGSAELELPDDELEEAENDVIAELRGLGAGDTFRYIITKVATKPGEKNGYCATLNAGDLSLDAIRDQFGGGKYRIKVVNEAGHYQGNRTVEIVDLPKATQLQQPAAAPALDLQGIAALLTAVKPNAPAAAAGGDGTGIAAIMSAMMAAQTKTFEAIMAQQRGPSITELLTILNSNKGDSDSGPVAMLLKGLELGKTLQGGGETGAFDVAREGLNLIAELASKPDAAPPPGPPRIAQQPALPARVAAPPASGVVHRAQATPQGAENMGILEKLNWLRKQVASLVVQASRDKDPALYAEVMLDNLPEFITDDEILQRLSAPDAVQQLAQLDSRVLQFADWFERFRVEVMQLLSDDDPDEDQQPQGPEEPGAGTPA